MKNNIPKGAITINAYCPTEKEWKDAVSKIMKSIQTLKCFGSATTKRTTS